MERSSQGFTLIELSIVLVIIGLIVGGILVGRDLISSAAVRAQISQIEKYQQAVNTFRGKYGYLPGDIKEPEATQFKFASRGQYAGEGDGNGLIEGIVSDDQSGHRCLTQLGGEQAMFWVDLSAVSLVDGSFATATANAPYVSGETDSYLPKVKINGVSQIYVWCGGWRAYNPGEGDGNNYFGISPSGSIGSSSASMTVAQAYSIDKKMDDGVPQLGVVIAISGSETWGWASGNPTYTGDFSYNNGLSFVPTTPEVTLATYSSGNGVTPDQTCYNNGDTKVVEHYSLEINNGIGFNCTLSFRFQ